MAKTAVVATNLTDLWSEPKYNSERVNQALYAEIVTVGEVEGNFTFITLPDGYRGWIDSRFLAYPPKLASSNYAVVAHQAKVHDKSRRSVYPFRLYYGTRIRGRKSAAGYIVVKGADGTTFLLNSRDLLPIMTIMKRSASPSQICREAERFLGVPYLWGGRSPVGYDCSGFMQSIFARFGIEIPRDTRDQIECGRRIKREEVRKSDLLFFNRHVALALNRTTYIHCSAGAPGVAVNSFEQHSNLYRPDLDREFDQARRIL